MFCSKYETILKRSSNSERVGDFLGILAVLSIIHKGQLQLECMRNTSVRVRSFGHTEKRMKRLRLVTEDCSRSDVKFEMATAMETAKNYQDSPRKHQKTFRELFGKQNLSSKRLQNIKFQLETPLLWNSIFRIFKSNMKTSAMTQSPISSFLRDSFFIKISDLFINSFKNYLSDVE